MTENTHTLETRIILQQDGYDSDDIDYIIKAYETLMKHKGFKDTRKDERFIVKFHRIFYYWPTEVDEFQFESFCRDMYEDTLAQLKEDQYVDYEDCLTMRPALGHYRSLKIKMDEITEDNALDLAQLFAFEYGSQVERYIEMHIKIVDVLQNLEDTYFKRWLDFAYENDLADGHMIKEAVKRYNKKHNTNPIKLKKGQYK